MKRGKTHQWLGQWLPLGRDSDWKKHGGLPQNGKALFLVISLCSLCENPSNCTLKIYVYVIVQL